MTEYHDNGEKKTEATYIDGELGGKSVSYYESGNIAWEHNYVDGNKDGKSVGYLSLINI